MLCISLGNQLAGVKSHRAIQHALALAALTVCGAILFFYRLDRRALWSSHEGRAGQHAQLMLDTGQWGMPSLYGGVADYQKPPLYYWLIAAAAACRGGPVDEWAVRLPAAAGALGGVWLVYALAAVVWRPGVCFAAALILVSNARFSWLARVGRIDMPLMLTVSGALVCFFAAYRRIAEPDAKRSVWCVWRWMLPAYLSVAVAVMLKGPVGFLLPAVPVLLFLVSERQPIWPWKRGFRYLMHQLGLGWGVALVLIVAAPWYVWASVTTGGEFAKVFFLHHHLDRTLGVEGLKPAPFWYYVPRLFVDAFPWSLMLPGAVWWAARGAWSISDRTTRFACCWVAGMFLFLSLVRFKRHDYLLPLMPGVALLLTAYWTSLFQSGDATRSRPGAYATGWGWLVLLGASGFALLIAQSNDLVRRVTDSPLVLAILHETDRTLVRELGAILSRLSAASIVAVFGCILAALFALLLIRKSRPIAAVTCLAVSWMAAFVLYVGQVLPEVEPMRQQRSIAELARRVRPEMARLYYYGREDQQLMFYLGPRSHWLPDRTALRPVITKTEPVFVVMERERFLIRLHDWPDVAMVPLATNTENRLGRHEAPVVLVTNAAGREFVRAERRTVEIVAN